MRTCSVTGCTAKHFGHGLCSKHYTRLRRTGSTEIVRVGHRFKEIDPSLRIANRSQWVGDCLIYQAAHRGSRSGHVAIGFCGKFVGVHRVAWILAHGDPPPGMVVRHRCDNPRCVNLDHLELGTVGENNRDRDERGRHHPLLGSSNGYAKLTEQDVIAIRGRLAAGESQRSIASAFGVHQYAIWRIASGRGWRHVPAVGAS